MRKPPNLPPLYPIVDVEVARLAKWPPLDLARAYLSGGATLLQLRAKTLESGAFLELAQSIVAMARESGARVIINDRADVARLAEADGVHVGQHDLAPADVRRVTGDGGIIGLSTHTDAHIAAALAEPIDYLAIGPVFSTTTKATGYDAVGYDAVRHAARQAAAVGREVVAIGGITLDTAARVIEAGATSLAIITDLVTERPEARIRQYLTALAL